MVTNLTSLVVVTGDWHVNDTVGLCPPIYHREKQANYRPGPAVRALWRAWTEFWSLIAEKKKETGATVYAIANGDLGDMNRHDTVQLISPRRMDVKRAMIDVAKPMVDVADKVFVIRGTAAHTGGCGELEEFLAQDITSAVHCPDEKSASWWVLRAMFGGVRFDITHHPPTASRRPWTRNAAVGRAAAIVAGRYLKEGLERERPDYAIFSHAHYHGAGAEMGTEARFIPPFKMVGAFGHRLGSGAHVEKVGGWWALCEAGKVIAEDFELWGMARPKIWKES